MTERAADVGTRLRVLIVGAGRRVQNNFLPSLNCLRESFEIVGLHARTEERLLPVAARWNTPVVRKIQDFDLGAVDVVAISVPTSQNAQVMEQLVSHASNLTLVIDTPIVANRKELAAVTPLLKNFRQVVVAEDYMNFPPFALLRKVVQEGLIGDLRAAILYNIGYAYHGLALIRSFAGFRFVLRSWRDPLGTFTNTVNYRFGNGFRACVIGPYRPQRNGGIVVEGSRAVITEVPGDLNMGDPKHRPIFTLNKIHENNLIRGFSIDDGTKRLAQLDIPEVAMMEKMDFQDKSELNLLRGCGLITVFRSLIEAKNINSTYGYNNALYDSLIGALANRGLLPFDPLVLVRSNMMLVMRALSKII